MKIINCTSGKITIDLGDAFSQVISQIRNSVTDSDVVIIFDTKGDFYDEFYREGDIVISNDDTATGANGKDYWNIFGEIERDSQTEETIVEITKTIFREKLEIGRASCRERV